MPVQERIYEAPGRICRRMHGMRRRVLLNGITWHSDVRHSTVDRWMRHRTILAHQILWLSKLKLSQDRAWVGANRAASAGKEGE